MKDSNKKKTYPIIYDYWVDRKNKIVYAVIEYNDKEIDWKHSNLYLISTEYKGNKKGETQ